MRRRLWAAWGVWVAAAGLLACGASERVVPVEPVLWVEPAQLSFGNIPVLHGVERTVRVTNGGRAPLWLDELGIEGGDGAFAATWTGRPGPLRPGEGRDVVVRFAPLRPGARAAALVLRGRDEGVGPARLPLDGTALPVGLRVSVPALAFGRIELESEKVRVLAVENVSDVPLRTSAAFVGAGAGEYAAAPPLLAPHEARDVAVTFRPSRVGRLPAAWTVRACPACPPEVIWLEAEGLEQAVVAEPPDVSLGAVALDQGLEAELRVHNLSTEPFTLTGAGLGAQGDPSFLLEIPPFPRVLAANERAAVPVRFSPGHAGVSESPAFVAVASRRHPTTDFQLHAWGGAPELCVDPEGYDFGPRPVGSRTSVTVSLRHCGSDDAAPLELTDVSLGGGARVVPAFSVLPPALPLRLVPGQEATVRVRFEPEAAGPSVASLHVRMGGPGGGELTWPLSGEGVQLPPCALRVTPGVVDFAQQAPGSTQVLGVRVANVGADGCAIKDVRVLDSGGGVFSLPGGELEGLVVEPGGAFSFMVAFSAPAGGPGSFQGTVGFTQANPQLPQVEVPLRAQVADSCLAWVPPYVDFGLSRPDCAAPELTVTLENRCAVARRVGGVRLGPGTADGEFELVQGPAVGTVLPPGGGAAARVRYLGQVAGMNLSPLLAEVDGEPAPLEATLVGESSTEAWQVDRWTQVDAHKLDVLLVVDNTASMLEEQPRLVAAAPALISALQQRGVDFHVAVTTTGLVAAGACPGGASGGEAGRLFPVDGSLQRVLTGATPGAAARLQALVQVGRCAQVEMGMAALERALAPPLVDGANAGFLRADAALAVIAVSDEDDHSPGAVADSAAFLAGVKGPGQAGRVAVHGIVPAGRGCATAGSEGGRWVALVQATNGALMDACAADYAPLLTRAAGTAAAPSVRFPLSHGPAPGTLEVRVDGQPATGWQYVPASREVVFTSPPPSGARVEVAYERLCGGKPP